MIDRCSEVSFSLADAHYGESPIDTEIGDLVWDPKMGDGHVIAGDSESFSFGWEDPWTVHVCECGRVDLLDHHVVILARA